MSQRLDALSVRESNGKSYFTKIGSAFPAKTGEGYSLLLDAIPAPVDGQFKILLRVPLPKDGQRSAPAADYPNYGKAPPPGFEDLDDSEMPF